MVYKSSSSSGGGGSGTLTQVNTGIGLTGGPITHTGTISSTNIVTQSGTQAYGGVGGVAVPVNINLAAYSGKSFDPSAQITTNGIDGIAWKTDGTKAYFGDFNSGIIYQYSASTAWDATSLTYASKSFNVTTQVGANSLSGFVISNDGTKLLAVSTNNGHVFQYNLGTPWDISTASYSSSSFSVTSQVTNPQGIFLRADGLKFYVGDFNSNVTYQYSLGTPNTISTASYDSKSFNTSAQVTTADGIAFSSDGLAFYNGDFHSGIFYQYTLGSAWDISTASYSGNSLNASANTSNEAQDIVFSSDMRFLYLSNLVTNVIYEYNMPITLTSGNLSGDVTTSGSLATTIAKIQGTSVAGTTGTGFVAFSTGPNITNIALSGSSNTTSTPAVGDNSTKIASTAYVTTAITNAISGVNPAVAVQAATTQASDTSGLAYNNGVSGIGATLTGANNTALTVDGFTFTAIGQRLLVKNDTQSPSGAFNGVYYVTQLQASLLPLILTRALDYDTPSDINNTGAIPVVNGTANATTSWLLTSAVNTVGTDPLTYTKFTSNPNNVLSTTLNSANIFVGNESNVATGVSPSGAITINNAGVTALNTNYTKRTIGFSAYAPTTGQQGAYYAFPVAGTITGYKIMVDAGTCTIQTWKIASGTTSPTSGNSISTSGVSLSTGTALISSTTSDFTTTTVSANDMFAFNLSAVSGVTRLTFELEITVT